MAVADIRLIEGLGPDGDVGMHLHRPLEAPPGFLRYKLFRSAEALLVSDVLPMLEHMGAKVVDERPYEIEPDDRDRVWIYDFGLRSEKVTEIDTAHLERIFQEAFAAVWRQQSEDDGFNRLVLLAWLRWRDVAVLRAYARYLRQVGSTFSQTYMHDTLAAHPDIARLLIELFHARFDPDKQEDDAYAHTIELAAKLASAIDQVEILAEDRILRSFLH